MTIDKQKDYKTKPQKPLQDDNKQKDCKSDQKKQISTDLPVPEHKIADKSKIPEILTTNYSRKVKK